MRRVGRSRSWPCVRERSRGGGSGKGGGWRRVATGLWRTAQAITECSEHQRMQCARQRRSAGSDGDLPSQPRGRPAPNAHNTNADTDAREQRRPSKIMRHRSGCGDCCRRTQESTAVGWLRRRKQCRHARRLRRQWEKCTIAVCGPRQKGMGICFCRSLKLRRSPGSDEK